MNTAYCTIITANYIHYAMALFDSLVEYKEDINFVLGVSDIENFNYQITDKRITVIGLVTLKDYFAKAKEIYDNYFPHRMDHLRWSMKPVILKYVLENGYSKAFWLDCDLFFCNKFDFLEKELDTHRFLLSPHWKSIHPWKEKEYKEFYTLMQSGMYNAGFVGARKDSIDILDWWAEACAFKCVRNYTKGFFVDQSYLETVPIYFENIGILKHRGCNLASWNIHLSKRGLDAENKVKINNEWEVVFLHLTKRTISLIEGHEDPLLRPFLKGWKVALSKYRKRFGLKPPPPNTKLRRFNAFVKRNIKKIMSLRIYIQH